MTRKEALQILNLDSGVTQEDIKKAYRTLAFSLHPDLNPDKPDAGKAFQRLNEAYVYLTAAEQPKTRTASGTAPNGGQRRGTAYSQEQQESRKETTQKVRADAFSAYEKARKRFQDAMNGSRGRAPDDASTAASSTAQSEHIRNRERDEVLQDLLRDPFARRVFEDIYSQIRQDTNRKKPSPSGTVNRHNKSRQAVSGGGQATQEPGVIEKTTENVSAWLRRQIDEEQTVHFSGRLAPGMRIRLQIEHGLFGKSQTIELTLPLEFEPGKPIRLKGMGKQIGKWRGDLYLKIFGSAS